MFRIANDVFIFEPIEVVQRPATSLFLHAKNIPHTEQTYTNIDASNLRFSMYRRRPYLKIN